MRRATSLHVVSLHAIRLGVDDATNFRAVTAYQPIDCRNSLHPPYQPEWNSGWVGRAFHDGYLDFDTNGLISATTSVAWRTATRTRVEPSAIAVRGAGLGGRA
jgi:hypothetical protein